MDPIAFMTGVLVASSLYVFAYRRRGSVADTRLGARVLEVVSPGSTHDVFDKVAAIGPPYRVDDSDRTKLVLVLSSRPSIWSYGFLYPVVIREREGGGSTIAVGVCSRLIHIGPGVGHAHERCVRAIEALLTVPPARLA